jgi:hypothetical protein
MAGLLRSMSSSTPAGSYKKIGRLLISVNIIHHAVNKYQDSGDLNKEKNEWIALNRATDEDLQRISKLINYQAKRDYLNQKYGKRK